MALVGDLKQLSIARVLEVLAAGRKSGVLSAKSGKLRLQAQFSRGRLRSSSLSERPDSATYLVAECAPAEHRESVRSLCLGSEVAVALWLDYCGLATAQQTLTKAREWGCEAFAVSATWRKGDLRFEDAASMEGTGLDLNLGLTPLIHRLRKGA